MHIFRIMNHINIGTQSHYIVGLLSMNDSPSYEEYGNTGCGVFKWGVQNWKDFCQKSTYLKEIIEF